VLIAVVNKSIQVSDMDVYNATVACGWQAWHHIAPAWGMLPPQVVFCAASSVPPGAAVMLILDNADTSGDLAWHTEQAGGQVSGEIFAETILANGGTPLSGLSVSSALSHEIAETMGDAACNRYAMLADGQSAYAVELADPVEGDTYPVTVGSGPAVSVSNFVLPPWFDPDAAASSQFDYLQLTSAPFQVRSTGYVIVLSGSQVATQWGADYPAWKKQYKQRALARTRRRLHPGPRTSPP
jgi:hypothetical protein